MTLKELVAKLTRDISMGAPSSVERRVRHWSSSGILRTTGTMFPGQGQSRTYDDEAMYVAAVLNELSKYGVPLGPLGAVAAGIYSALADRMIINDAGDSLGALWQEAKRGAKVGLTIAQHGPSPASADSAHVALSIDSLDGQVNPFFPAELGDSIILIDLRRLFARLGA